MAILSSHYNYAPYFESYYSEEGGRKILSFTGLPGRLWLNFVAEWLIGLQDAELCWRYEAENVQRV